MQRFPPLFLDELLVPQDLLLCQPTPRGRALQIREPHLPALLRDWRVEEHYVLIVQRILLCQDPVETVLGSVSGIALGQVLHGTPGPLPLMMQALAVVFEVSAGSRLAAFPSGTPSCPTGPVLPHDRAVAAGGEGTRAAELSRDCCRGQPAASHNPYCYQLKTCTLNRMMTYAFAMNRICTGGIGMGRFDLLCVCVFLSFPRGGLRGRQGGWRML